MKNGFFYKGEWLAICAGLIISLVSLYLFPFPESQRLPLTIIPSEQRNNEILSSGTYDPNTFILPVDCGNYSVWINRGTEVLPISSKAGIRLADLIPYRKDQLMYIAASPIWKVPVGKFQGATTVRIKNNRSSKVYYRTFFKKNSSFHLPVISLILNESDFFDAQKGVYVQGTSQGRMPLRTKWWDMPGNYTLKGKEYETVGYFDFFNPNGVCSYSSFAGVRIHGNATRAFPQKSFRITALSASSEKTFNHDFFNQGRQPSHALILRNGGNDWGRTLIADAFMQALVVKLNVDAQFCVPVTLYINGEYWGIYSLREKVDEDFICARYGCKKNKVTLIEMDQVKNGKKKEYKKLTDLIDRLTRKPDENVFHELAEQVDMDNFMNYLFAELYFGNTDWPHNNCKYYKANERKWRWAVYDLDYGYGYIGNPAAYQADLFNVLFKSNAYTAKLFRLLMQTQEFRSGFMYRCEQVLKNELTLPRQLRRMEMMASCIQPEMPSHINRWRKPVSMEQWEQYLNELRVFARNRNRIFKEQLVKYCH